MQYYYIIEKELKNKQIRRNQRTQQRQMTRIQTNLRHQKHHKIRKGNKYRNISNRNEK
jgi:hypothetical protein